MLHLNTYISLPLSNGGPSYTCERIVAAMANDDLSVRIFTPADRRATVQTDVDVQTIMPRWAKNVPFRISGGAASAMAERSLLQACRSSGVPNAAFLWSDVSPSLPRRLRDAGTIVVREKFNCARAVSRDILRAAYAGLGALGVFSADQYGSKAIDAEMESLRQADMIYCPSPMVAWSLREVGISQEKLVATSYGFDPARLAGVSKALPEIDGPTFLFVGYACVRKGAHILLSAWEKAGINGRLIIVGQMEPLIAERFADILARPDVEHHPFTRDVGSYYRSADYFVFPSLEEGSPLVTYEATFCGLPSIVSPMGAGAVVRHGVDGLIIDGNDPRDWASAIADAAASHDRYAKWGENAHSHSLEFSWNRVGQKRRQLLLERVGMSRAIHGEPV